MRARTALFLPLLAAGCVEANSRPLAATASSVATTGAVVLSNGEPFAGCPPATVLRGFPKLKDAGATYCVTEIEPAQREGPFVSFYPSGKILARGTYFKGNPDGPWTTYHESGQVLSQGGYLRGVRDGQWRFGTADGRPVFEEMVSAGVRVSWVEHSYEKGILQGLETFQLDAKNRRISHGPAQHVNADGNVLSGQFQRGKGEGVWEEKTSRGVVVLSLTLQAGFAEPSVEAFWPENGKPSATGGLTKTLPQGTWTLFYPGGEKRAELLYEKGLLRSLVAFYPDGKRQLTGEFLDGAPHAAWTAHHPNGTLQTSGAYARGLRQGMWRTADESGKTVAEGEYVDGVLNQGQNVAPLSWSAIGLGASLQTLFSDLAFITVGRGRIESEQQTLAECLLFGDPAEKCLSLDWENFPSFHANDGPAEIDRRNKQQDLACAMNNPAACARVGKRLSAAALAAKDKKPAPSMVAGHYQKACDLALLETAWKARDAAAKRVFKDFHAGAACVWLGRMLDAAEVKSRALASADLYKRACEMDVAEGCTAMAEAAAKKGPGPKKIAAPNKSPGSTR